MGAFGVGLLLVAVGHLLGQVPDAAGVPARARRPTARVLLIIQAHPVRSAGYCAEPSSSIRQLTPTVLAYGHHLLRMVLRRRTCSPARRFPDSKTTALGLLD